MDKKYVCADCGHHQYTLNLPCESCGSIRVILVSVAVENFGPDYMKCFDSKDIVGPSISKDSFEAQLADAEPSPEIDKLRTWWQAELEKGIQDFHISCRPGFEISDFEDLAAEMNAIERGDTKPFEDI